MKHTNRKKTEEKKLQPLASFSTIKNKNPNHFPDKREIPPESKDKISRRYSFDDNGWGYQGL